MIRAGPAAARAALRRPGRAAAVRCLGGGKPFDYTNFGIDDRTHAECGEWGEKRMTGVSLKTLLDTGRGELLGRYAKKEDDQQHTATQQVLMQVAMFLHHELPIRLARRVLDLQTTPLLIEMESVRLVHRWYLQSFAELRAAPVPDTPEKEQHFATLVQNIYQRHAATLLTMARGAYELRREVNRSDVDGFGKGRIAFEDHREIHHFLDSFYMSRIGIRVLIGQYLALRQPPVTDYIGLVCTRTSAAQVAQAAVEDATYMCERQYGEAPSVTLHGQLDNVFPYVPTHLHYILLELLKNSMRATCEFHGDEGALPHIKVIVADGDANEDVVIKVSDEGGGIRRSHMKRIWSYLFTTAAPSVQEGFVDIGGAAGDHDTDSPLAGLGFGLPISRAYARYFGGDLQASSLEGWGTDVFLYLRRTTDSDEPLP